MTSLTRFSTLSLQDCAAVTGGSKRKGWVDIGIGLAQEAFGHIDDIVAGFNEGNHRNFPRH